MNGNKKNKGVDKRQNIAVEVFGRIWALWGLITFIVTFMVIFLPTMSTYFIKGNRGQAIFIQISKFWMDCWLFLVGCSLKVTGKENFVKGKTYVVACNHNSLLDPTVTCPYIPGANKTIAKMSFAKVPIFGWFYRKGSVLVDRKDAKSRLKSFEEMKEVIAQQMHMCIYPEGTRNQTGDYLKAFYDGAFTLAVASNVPVIPTVICNTEKALPVNKPFFFLPYKITIQFLPEVSSEGKSAKELKEEVYNIMYNYLKEKDTVKKG